MFLFFFAHFFPLLRQDVAYQFSTTSLAVSMLQAYQQANLKCTVLDGNFTVASRTLEPRLPAGWSAVDSAVVADTTTRQVYVGQRQMTSTPQGLELKLQRTPGNRFFTTSGLQTPANFGPGTSYDFVLQTSTQAGVLMSVVLTRGAARNAKDWRRFDANSTFESLVDLPFELDEEDSTTAAPSTTTTTPGAPTSSPQGINGTNSTVDDDVNATTTSPTTTTATTTPTSTPTTTATTTPTTTTTTTTTSSTSTASITFDRADLDTGPVFVPDPLAKASIGFQIHHTPVDAARPCASLSEQQCADGCRFDAARVRCVETHRVLVWMRFDADEDEPKYKWIELDFDPSAAAHQYVLDVTAKEQTDLTLEWKVELLIDGQAAATFYNIPPLPSGTGSSLLVNLWSTLEQLPPSTDPFHPWAGVAYVRSIDITPTPTMACTEGAAFYDFDSNLHYRVAVGTSPFSQNIVRLRSVDTVSVEASRTLAHVFRQGRRYNASTLQEDVTSHPRLCLNACEAVFADFEHCAPASLPHADFELVGILLQNLNLTAGSMRNSSDVLTDDVVEGEDAGLAGEDPGEAGDEVNELEAPGESAPRVNLALQGQSGELVYVPARYYVTVEAVNGAGWRVAATTQGITIDVTPPLFADPTREDCRNFDDEVRNPTPCGEDPVQYDPAYLDAEGKAQRLPVEYQGTATSMGGTWHAVDEESPVASYDVSVVKDDVNHTEVYPYVSVDMQEDVQLDQLALEQGQRYCLRVRAWNAAGLATEKLAQCATVDVTPPDTAHTNVVTSTGELLRAEVVGTRGRVVVIDEQGRAQLQVQLTNFDDPESGVLRIELGVGLQEGGIELLPFVFVSQGEEVDVQVNENDLRVVRLNVPPQDVPGDINFAQPYTALLNSDEPVRVVYEPGSLYFVTLNVMNGAHLMAVLPGLEFHAVAKREWTLLVTCQDQAGNVSMLHGLPAPVPLPDCPHCATDIKLDMNATWALKTSTIVLGYEPANNETNVTTPITANITECARPAAGTLMGWLSQDMFSREYPKRLHGVASYIQNPLLVVPNRTREAELRAQWTTPAPLYNCTVINTTSSADNGTMVVNGTQEVTNSTMNCTLFEVDHVEPTLPPVDPRSLPLSRMLLGRLREFLGASFFVSPLSHEPLDQPLVITVNFDPQSYNETLDVPVLAYWNPRRQIWMDAGESCPGRYLPAIDYVEGRMTVPVCNTYTLNSSPRTVVAQRRAAPPTGLSHQTQFALFLANPALLNTAPVVPAYRFVVDEDEVLGPVQLNYTDAEDDAVVFSLAAAAPGSNTTRVDGGTASLTADGRLWFVPDLFFFGSVEIELLVTEVPWDSRVAALTTRVTVHVEVRAQPSPPRLFFVINGRLTNEQAFVPALFPKTPTKVSIIAVDYDGLQPPPVIAMDNPSVFTQVRNMTLSDLRVTVPQLHATRSDQVYPRVRVTTSAVTASFAGAETKGLRSVRVLAETAAPMLSDNTLRVEILVCATTEYQDANNRLACAPVSTCGPDEQVAREATITSDRVCVAASSSEVPPAAIAGGATAAVVLLVLVLVLLLVHRRRERQRAKAASAVVRSFQFDAEGELSRFGAHLVPNPLYQETHAEDDLLPAPPGVDEVEYQEFGFEPTEAMLAPKPKAVTEFTPEAYLHPRLSRPEAKRLLVEYGLEPGTFLLYTMNERDGLYGLYYVSFDNEVSHKLIKRKSDGMYMDGYAMAQLLRRPCGTWDEVLAALGDANEYTRVPLTAFVPADEAAAAADGSSTSSSNPVADLHRRRASASMRRGSMSKQQRAAQLVIEDSVDGDSSFGFLTEDEEPYGFGGLASVRSDTSTLGSGFGFALMPGASEDTGYEDFDMLPDTNVVDNDFGFGGPYQDDDDAPDTVDDDGGYLNVLAGDEDETGDTLDNSSGSTAVPRRSSSSGSAGSRGGSSRLATTMMVVTFFGLVAVAQAGMPVLSSELNTTVRQIGLLAHQRYADDLGQLHMAYDTSGGLTGWDDAAATRLLTDAQVGVAATRSEYVRGFVTSVDGNADKYVARAELLAAFEQLGWRGDGSLCNPATKAGFCPELSATLAEDGRADTCACAEAAGPAAWPTLVGGAAPATSALPPWAAAELCTASDFAACLEGDASHTCEYCARTTGCRVLTQGLTFYAAPQLYGVPLLAASDVGGAVAQLNEAAASCEVLVVVQSSFVPLAPSTLAGQGRALSFHVRDSQGYCNDECLAESSARPDVQCLLTALEGHNLVALGADLTLELKPHGEAATLMALSYTHRCFGRVVLPGSTVQPAAAAAGADGPPTQATEQAAAEAPVTVTYPSGLTVPSVEETMTFDTDEFANPFESDLSVPLLDACAPDSCCAAGQRCADGRPMAQLSENFQVYEFLSPSAGTLSVAYPVRGRTVRRARFFRVDPRVVECLQRVRSFMNEPVVVLDGYHTAQDARARGQARDYHRSGKAARVALAQDNTAARMVELAFHAVRLCAPLFESTGQGMGVGLYADSVSVDVRPLGAAGVPLETFTGEEAGMAEAEFAVFAQRAYTQSQRYMERAECPADLAVPQRQGAGFERDGGAEFRRRRGVLDFLLGDTEFCEQSRSRRVRVFNDMWRAIDRKYKTLDVGGLRDPQEVKDALGFCFKSCDPGGLFRRIGQAVGSNTAGEQKIAACDNALHWLPFGFGKPEDLHDTCQFYATGSAQREAACFWGRCVDKTELYGLLAPPFTKTFRRRLTQRNPGDPYLNEPEPLFSVGLNPTPVFDLMRRLFAVHCTGRVTVWVDNVAELIQMRYTLKVLLGFNRDVTFVDVKTPADAYYDVVDVLNNFVDDWVSELCRERAREQITPFIVTKIGAIDKATEK